MPLHRCLRWATRPSSPALRARHHAPGVPAAAGQRWTMRASICLTVGGSALLWAILVYAVRPLLG